jgi:hypothetical protein
LSFNKGNQTNAKAGQLLFLAGGRYDRDCPVFAPWGEAPSAEQERTCDFNGNFHQIAAKDCEETVRTCTRV